MEFKKVDPHSLTSLNPFDAVGKEWFLICAKADGITNAMTASWGFLGNIWNKPAAVCFIRPQRFTHTLTEKTERVSLCFLGHGYRRELGIFGNKSGKDTDKAAETGFHYIDLGGVPAIGESRIVLVCRTMYVDKLEPSGFTDPTLNERHYPTNDHHTVYVCEVEECYVAE